MRDRVLQRRIRQFLERLVELGTHSWCKKEGQRRKKGSTGQLALNRSSGQFKSLVRG